MSNVARGVQEVKVSRGYFPSTDRWAWQAFLQNGKSAVFCNHWHKSADAALVCAGKMTKAGGHPIHIRDHAKRKKARS